jgi:hypothetical protein
MLLLPPTRTSGSRFATAYRSFANTLQDSSREVMVAMGVQFASGSILICRGVLFLFAIFFNFLEFSFFFEK